MIPASTSCGTLSLVVPGCADDFLMTLKKPGRWKSKDDRGDDLQPLALTIEPLNMQTIFPYLRALHL